MERNIANIERSMSATGMANQTNTWSEHQSKPPSGSRIGLFGGSKNKSSTSLVSLGSEDDEAAAAAGGGAADKSKRKKGFNFPSVKKPR